MNYNGIEHDSYRPLDNLTIPYNQNGVIKQIPAVHVMWVQPRCYLHYTPPPQQQPDGSFLLGAKQDWLDTMKCILEDLEWLLGLKQYQFWSQIVHDEGVMDMIVSFLQEGYPYYMINEFPRDGDMWKTYQRIYRLVLLVIIRLSTYSESESEYMTPHMLGQLIYNNYVFSICIMLDLCLLYGRENRKLISQVIERVFEVQPQYDSDLRKSVGCMTQVFLGISAQLDVPMEATGEFLGRLKSPKKNKLTLETLGDLISHTFDAVMALSSLLDIYLPSCASYHRQMFEIRIVSFYENTLPELYRKLETVANNDNTSEVYVKLKKRLDMTRVELLKAFRYILSSSVNHVLTKKDMLSAEERKAAVDDYVHVLTESLGDRRFVRDYHTKYPLDQDLDILAQLCPEMDKLKSDYLLESAWASFDVPAIKKPKPANIYLGNRSTAGSEAVNEASMVKKNKVTGIKLQSLISQVKDLLPHLGEGFVESCLDYYDYSSDAVVNAVLENQLPPELQAMDFNMPRIPTNEDDQNLDGLDLEQEVYDEEDDDESAKIDYSKSHRGKRKGEFRDLRDMMKDKSHREEFRDQYSQLGYVDTMYDDEYDDTYDHLDVSVQDDGDLERRPTVVPRVLRQKGESESSGGEYTDEEEEEPVPGPPRDQFVPNPEELRAKAEQRRLTRQHNKPKTKDVVGQPKGHGQEKQVVLNRNRKTTNKASRGNHNRRAGAQRKRNQGMLPS